MRTLLFLCTGNYYRSRFAEFYFRSLAMRYGLRWHVVSRGIRLNPANQGSLSQYTLRECQRLGIAAEPLRMPLALQEDDLVSAHRTIAVKESEHRPLMRMRFPAWEERVEYWHVHDIDAGPPSEALQLLRQHVDRLIDELRRSR